MLLARDTANKCDSAPGGGGPLPPALHRGLPLSFIFVWALRLGTSFGHFVLLIPFSDTSFLQNQPVTARGINNKNFRTALNSLLN